MSLARATPARTSFDVIIAGGGLAGQLSAHAIRKADPALSVAMVERAPRLGGNQTWCCHASDLAGAPAERERLRAWLMPLLDVRWPRHRVRFPGFDRMLDGEYLCIRAASLAQVTHAVLAGGRDALLTGRTVRAMDCRTIELDSGEQLHASVVLDARGDDPSRYVGRTGFQKFLGWEVEHESASPTRFAVPVLMDATVAQSDGFRFVYTLPFSSSRLLVEDTTFSRGPDLDPAAARVRIAAYLRDNAIADYRVCREESGVLPMPWAGPRRATEESLAIGYRGGFFHPGTGYSLARGALVAQRIADVVRATSTELRAQAVANALAECRDRWAVDDRFSRLLNRLAFTVVPPDWLRRHVFERVYRLPQPTLERFYAGRTSPGDRIALAVAPLRIPLLSSTPPHRPFLGENP
jgi:lycopene beta-cyclase